jgi:hypothetical protein
MSTKASAGDMVVKRALWSKRIGQWEGSGQTQRAFCAKGGLALSTFQWWRTRLEGGAAERRQKAGCKAAVSFVPVALGVGALGGGGSVHIELACGTRLRVEGEAALHAIDVLLGARP